MTTITADMISALNAALDAERDSDGYVEPGRLAAVGELCDAIGVVGSGRMYLVNPNHPVVEFIERA